MEKRKDIASLEHNTTVYLAGLAHLEDMIAVTTIDAKELLADVRAAQEQYVTK